MRSLLAIVFTFAVSISFSQSKESLINSSPKDSVIQYEGEGVLRTGNCLILKYSGDAQAFFTELIYLHVQDEHQIERTETTLAIYETTKPYWIYGRYSVFAQQFEKSDHTLIEIWFMGYSNPDNLKIYGAAREYQRIVNKLLKK